MVPALAAAILMNMAIPASHAQDEAAECPCFNAGEVAAVFAVGEQVITEAGMFECAAEDYSVEFSAEVVAWDEDFEVVAQAKVKWLDIDPSQCVYIDSRTEPAIERDVSTPPPAPEAASRACLDIIKSAIAEFDAYGDCFLYP